MSKRKMEELCSTSKKKSSNGVKPWVPKFKIKSETKTDPQTEQSQKTPVTLMFKKVTRPSIAIPTCPFCKKVFTKTSDLHTHLKFQCTIDEPQTTLSGEMSLFHECPIKGCCKVLTTSLTLRNHIIYDHDISIKLERLSFDSQEDFVAWKHEMEEETSCNYSLHLPTNGSRLINNSITRFFNCCEIQKEDPSSTRTCPSKIEAIEEGKSLVTVLFYKTHLGHAQKDAVVLSKYFMSYVADLLAKGESVDKILNKIKENKISCKNCQNLRLITREHILLIAKDSNINTSLGLPEPVVLRTVMTYQTLPSTSTTVLPVQHKLEPIHSNSPTDLGNKKKAVRKKPKKQVNKPVIVIDHPPVEKKVVVTSRNEENIKRKLGELSELVNKGLPEHKREDIEKCLDLALRILNSNVKLVSSSS